MRLKPLDYLLVFIQVLLFVAYFLPVSINHAAPEEIPKLMLWPAQIAIMLGLFEMLWALKMLGKNLSPFPRPKEDAELITWGVFGLVRHPIYGGVFLFTVGLGFYHESIYKVMIALILLLFFYFKSRYEEKNLLAYYPNYRAYRLKVGRFFPKLSTAKPK
jgi:protein-S-isoprenylcysteine O-methyltransferase Ste14